MKRPTLLIAAMAMLVLFVTQDSQAQTNTSPNTVAARQDPVVQELLGEVRQLRIALQQISVNAYRGQVLVERLRLQQEQVNRVTQELTSTRSQISEMRSTQLGAKSRLDETEAQQDKGLASPTLTSRYREVLEDLKRREQTLSEREIQLTAQLEAERTNLADFNKRLDALELEMMITGQTDENRRPEKR